MTVWPSSLVIAQSSQQPLMDASAKEALELSKAKNDHRLLAIVARAFVAADFQPPRESPPRDRFITRQPRMAYDILKRFSTLFEVTDESERKKFQQCCSEVLRQLHSLDSGKEPKRSFCIFDGDGNVERINTTLLRYTNPFLLQIGRPRSFDSELPSKTKKTEGGQAAVSGARNKGKIEKMFSFLGQQGLQALREVLEGEKLRTELPCEVYHQLMACGKMIGDQYLEEEAFKSFLDGSVETVSPEDFAMFFGSVFLSCPPEDEKRSDELERAIQGAHKWLDSKPPQIAESIRSLACFDENELKRIFCLGRTPLAETCVPPKVALYLKSEFGPFFGEENLPHHLVISNDRDLEEAMLFLSYPPSESDKEKEYRIILIVGYEPPDMLSLSSGRRFTLVREK